MSLKRPLQVQVVAFAMGVLLTSLSYSWLGTQQSASTSGHLSATRGGGGGGGGGRRRSGFESADSSSVTRHRSYQRPCTASPYTSLFSHEQLAEVETAAYEWRSSLHLKVQKMLNARVNDGDKRHQLYSPTRRDTYSLHDGLAICPTKLERWGNTVGLKSKKEDGGKLLCGIYEANKDNNRCVIYSIGGNNQWDFEESVLARLPHCEIHTFDCTIETVKNKPEAVRFHKWCISDKDRDSKFMTLRTIMKRLKHDHLDLLKLDAEGWEYDVLSTIINGNDAVEPIEWTALPYQISFELHSRTDIKSIPWYPRQVSTAEDVVLASELHEAGYRSVSREDNPQCWHCTELTYVRLMC